MTMDGTQTYLIGRTRVVVVDPGPRLQDHLDAVADAVGDGVVVCIALTHSHPDHADGADALAQRVNASVRCAAAGTLHDGDTLTTDDGVLRAIATPGHTPDHFSFWWESERAAFCGDLMMGGMDTALVARPEGDLRDYLASLRLMRDLRPRVIYPAHGAPFEDPETAIAQYIAHREDRIAQVLDGLNDGPLSDDALVDKIYGGALDPRIRHYAQTAVQAYLAYLCDEGRVRESASGVWSLT